MGSAALRAPNRDYQAGAPKVINSPHRAVVLRIELTDSRAFQTRYRPVRLPRPFPQRSAPTKERRERMFDAQRRRRTAIRWTCAGYRASAAAPQCAGANATSPCRACSAPGNMRSVASIARSCPEIS
jgi:hypothetical protein